MSGTGSSRAARLQPLAVKVPQITLMFWVLKLLTTGIGEATSDFLIHRNEPLAVLIGTSGFCLALWLQLRARAYRAPLYWFAVLMVAVFGTMAADGAHVAAGLPYPVTTVLYALATAAAFVFWYRTEGTLSIHSIDTARREMFYWTAVLATFALGTAAGDLTALYLNLGFFVSIVLFASLIAIPAYGWMSSVFNPILAFWFAYVITRPLGASIADWLGKSRSSTGLGLGDGVVSALGLLVFVALVAYVTVTSRDAETLSAPTPAAAPLRQPAPPR